MAAKRKAGRKKKPQPTPGWVWLLAGLAIGLAIAAGIYIQDRGGTSTIVRQAKQAAQSIPKQSGSDDSAQAEDNTTTFSFYTMLPEQNSIVPDEEYSRKPKPAPKTIVEPGSYILQVAAFSTNDDAARLKANLALSGLAAKIQKVTVDGKAYHRVLIGPMTNLNAVNQTRSQLISMNLTPMTIQVND